MYVRDGRAAEPAAGNSQQYTLEGDTRVYFPPKATAASVT